jgi:hypothetical protein
MSQTAFDGISRNPVRVRSNISQLLRTNDANSVRPRALSLPDENLARLGLRRRLPDVELAGRRAAIVGIQPWGSAVVTVAHCEVFEQSPELTV